MAMPMYQMEGTWEEITSHVPNFAGQRLRVEFYPVAEKKTPAKENPDVALLRGIAERTAQIESGPDTRDWLREGRAGGMFGDESTE